MFKQLQTSDMNIVVNLWFVLEVIFIDLVVDI